MRWRGVSHIELSVVDYEASVAFYDRLFGWLGYRSFWTMDLGYRSTYYMARFPMPHSYVGLQPAKSGRPTHHAERAVGLHHLALWAKSRAEIDAFHRDFLIPEGVTVTDSPAEYPWYVPGYYAVFFDDPLNGFHLELAHFPYVPSLGQWRRFKAALKEKADAKGISDPMKQAMRPLPGRGR